MSSAPSSTSVASQSVTIFSAVAFYWMVSISMVFANKTLLGSPEMKTAPFFITWFQCFVTVIFCYVAGSMRVLNVPPFEVKKDVMKQMMSLSAVFTLMIVFNNLCLKYVEVSFYQVARSLTIVFNVIFDYVLLGQLTSFPAIACCATVVSGFALGNKVEMRWSLIGVLFGVTSSFFVAMNSIFVKKKIGVVENNVWKLTLYNNLNACFLFLPLIFLSGDHTRVLENPAIRTPGYWLMMVMSGLLGVMISFATGAQIKYTSPLTHNVSATAKAAAQTIISLQVYQNPISSLGKLSVAIVLLGSLAYTYVRRMEMNKKANEELANKLDNTKDSLLSSGSEKS